MGKPGAYLEVGRIAHGERPATETVEDFDEFAIPLSDDEQRRQASRCMNCGVAYCQTGIGFGRARTSGCPLHNLIPEWNDLVYRGLWEEAYERLSLTSPLPEFTSRVCPALCEAACNLGLNDDPTTVRDDERAISDHAWSAGLVKPLAKPAEDAPRVAVVGSGPAGLSCSWELARRGIRVVLFERADRPGGLLMYGIPNMKLPKEIVSRRCELMVQSGIEIRCGSDVSDPELAHELLEDFDAVVVAAGARAARKLTVPGAEAQGVFLAVDYLTSSTRSVLSGEAPKISAHDKEVVVIGGGDTGTDCVATALRQGARSVVQLEFLPEPPATREAAGNLWPEWPVIRKDDYGQREALSVQGEDPRSWATNTLEVLTDSAGSVRGLRVVSLDWSDGSPSPIKDSERELSAQLVLIAMGFSGPDADIFEALAATTVEFRGGVRPKISEGTAHLVVGSATTPVYAAGDARAGSSLVVSAIADGLACALEVAESLEH